MVEEDRGQTMKYDLEKFYQKLEFVYKGAMHCLMNFQSSQDTLATDLDILGTTGKVGAWIKNRTLANNNNFIFNNFELVSLSFNKNELKDSEALNLIFSLVLRNIEAGILFEKREIHDETEQFISHLSNHKRTEIILNAVNSGGYEGLTEIFKQTTLEAVTPTLFSLRLIDKANHFNLEDFRKKHKILKEHYLDKLDSFNIDDIDIIISTLKELSIDEELCNKVKNALNRILYKRTIREQKEKTRLENERSLTEAFKSTKSSKTIIPKKDFQVVYRELQQYYDFDNMKPKKFLSLNELIYCIHLMLKIDFDEKTINEFIESIEKENKKIQNNPISIFINLYNKFKYYEMDLNLTEKIKRIESYIGEIFICSSEDYEFWKESINEEVNDILISLPINHEYEVSEAKKLLK